MKNTSTENELIEQIAWQRLRAALFRHDAERSPSSWLDGRRAHSEWSVAYFNLDREPANDGVEAPL